MPFRQRALVEFLVKELIPAAEIHQRLLRAYGSVCMGASSVWRWVEHFKVGNTSIQDEPRSGRPRTASTERNKERVDEIIQDDRLVTVDTIARALGIGHNAVQEMVESLGYRKVCARSVPRLLTEEHKGQRKAITSELLQRYRHEDNDFCSVLWQVTKDSFTISRLKRNGRVWNGTICILHRKEGEDSAISCEGEGHSLLRCSGVDFGPIPETWANHYCCSLCSDTAQAPSCIAR